MWIPSSTEAIENAIAAGTLEETPSFDGKAALPATSKQNSSLAVDVAAMSTAGGVLLYGVGEDEHDRLTIRAPFELAGAADRFAQIVQTSISEVPFIRSLRYELPDEPSRGYLLVVVPPSPRAPHQVIVGDDRRFYGRGDKGNRRLSEQEVAELYRRRQESAVNLENRLSEAVQASRFQPVEDSGQLYAFVQPVPPSVALWDTAVAASGGRDQLQTRLTDAVAGAPAVVGGHDPNFNGLLRWYPEGAEAWRLSTQGNPSDDPRRAMFTAEITMNIDGRAVLFSGNIARRVSHGPTIPDEQSRKYLWEGNAVANLAALFTYMSAFFEAASYFGPVDCGVLLTGINDSFSAGRFQGVEDWRIIWPDQPHFNADRYAHVRQLASAFELAHADTLALDFLRRLTETTTGKADWNPFVPA